MGLANLLSIAQSALGAHQRAIETTSHNIANASTPGYTRQRVELLAATPFRASFGNVGRGVTIGGITNARDAYLDGQFRAENGSLGQQSVLSEQLGALEAMFGEPSDTGLAATLDAFWFAFGDLANDPSSGSARAQIQSAARAVVQTFHNLDDRFGTAASDAGARARDEVGQANVLAEQIASLNNQIASAEGNGRSANDLRDQRNRVFDQLSTMFPTRVVETASGSTTVLIGDALLVDGATALTLRVQSQSDGRLALNIVGSNKQFVPNSGSVVGYMEVVNDHVPRIRQAMDDLAAGIVQEVNAVHRTGVTTSGNLGMDFFDPFGVTGGTIRLTSLVDQSIDEIAAGTTGAPGDGSLALTLSGLGDVGFARFGGANISEVYGTIVGDIASVVRGAENAVVAQDILTSNLDLQRASVHGVSVDEEMVHLITQQQAYTAAARIVTVADEMIQEVLRMI